MTLRLLHPVFGSDGNVFFIFIFKLALSVLVQCRSLSRALLTPKEATPQRCSRESSHIFFIFFFAHDSSRKCCLKKQNKNKKGHLVTSTSSINQIPARVLPAVCWSAFKATPLSVVSVTVRGGGVGVLRTKQASAH